MDTTTVQAETKKLYIVFKHDKFVGAGVFSEEELKELSQEFTFVKM